MSVLTRHEFDKQETPHKDVSILWGGQEVDVRIIPMSARDLNDMRGGERDFRTIALVVCRCMVDADLNRLFQDDEVDKFLERPGSAGVIKSLVVPLMDLSGLRDTPPPVVGSQDE